MAISLKNKFLVGAALVGAIGIGTVSGEASAAITDTDAANLNGTYCDFDRSWFQDEVEWGDNQYDNDRIEIKGTLRFHDWEGGRCQLYVRYYNSSGNIVTRDYHTIVQNNSFPKSSYAHERTTNSSVVKARICTRSKKQNESDYGNYRCVSVLRGD